MIALYAIKQTQMPTIEFTVKGKPGPHELPQLAFMSGKSFHEAAIRCSEPVKDPYRPDQTVTPALPSVVCIAFAAELYLKSMIVERTGKMPESHRLDRLYNSLTTEQQKRVRRHYAQYAEVGKLKLKEHIGELANAFVDWRYAFEGSKNVRIDYLFALARASFTAITEDHPDWETSQYQTERITEGPVEKIAFLANLGGGHMTQARVKPKT